MYETSDRLIDRDGNNLTWCVVRVKFKLASILCVSIFYWILHRRFRINKICVFNRILWEKASVVDDYSGRLAPNVHGVRRDCLRFSNVAQTISVRQSRIGSSGTSIFVSKNSIQNFCNKLSLFPGLLRKC